MFRKWSTSFCVYNILITTHLQPEYTTNTHKTRSEQSARRRGPIHRTRIFTLPNMCIHIIKYTHSFHRTRVFVRHFVGIYGYAGTINRPLQLRTVCQNAANNLPFFGRIRICKHHKIVHQRTLATCYNTTTYTECLLSQCKNHTFARQKPPFCTPKTILLQRKNPLFG